MRNTNKDINIERFNLEKIVRNELTVLGSWNAISSPFPGKEWSASVHYMSTGQIDVKPIISHRLHLQEGPETFDKIINRTENFGKVLFFLELGYKLSNFNNHNSEMISLIHSILLLKNRSEKL